MINAGIYNYVNVLNKALDASWARQTVLANNISNQTTPGFKRQDVSFEGYLESELQGIGNIDQKIDKLDLNKINYTTYTDLSNYSYRMDGNNVDSAVEQANLASNQIRYQLLTAAMNSEFNRIKMAMS